MKNIGRTDIPDYGPLHPQYIHFGEDDQTFYVTQVDIDTTHGPQWNPDRRDVQRIPYENEDIGLPEWGIVHAIAPENSNKSHEVQASHWPGVGGICPCGTHHGSEGILEP